MTQSVPREAQNATIETNAALSYVARLRESFSTRLRGPGGTYNFGNAIALTAGLGIQISQLEDGATVWGAVRMYFVGSPGASWLTVAIVIFFMSGEIYHRAWMGDRPILGLVRSGDYLSALGAAALTVSLLYLGDILLALAAGSLLFGGKLGNAMSPSGTWPLRLEFPALTGSTRCIQFDVFRVAVVLSRLPSLAALGVQAGRTVLGGAPILDALLPAIMILCFLIWLRADLLLMETEDSPEA